MTEKDRPKGLGDLLVEQGLRFASQAAKVMMDDRRGQEAVAAAVGLAQKGMKRLEGVQEQVLHAVGLPAKTDYDEVAKQMARMKRKIRDLSRKVEAGAVVGGGRGAEGAGEAPEDAPGAAHRAAAPHARDPRRKR